MEGRVLKGVEEKELNRRAFLKAAGAATVLGAAGVLGGNLLLGCAPSKATPKAGVPAGYESIRIVGGSIGSRSTTICMTLATILNRYYPEIEWSSTSGSIATNVIYLTKGTVKLAIAQPGGYIAAYGFDKIPESRLRSINQPNALANYAFFIPEDKPWKDISEVPKGAALYPGAVGGGDYLACELWLGVAGLSKKDFNWLPGSKTEMGDAWRAGKLDLIFGPPAGLEPWVIDVMSSPRKIKPMGLSPEQVARAKADKPFERAGFTAPMMSNLVELTGGVFKYDVMGTQGAATLCSRDDFPEEIAYGMARVIDEHRAELVSIFSVMKYATPRYHIDTAGPPFDIHPGVAKYYREKGYLK